MRNIKFLVIISFLLSCAALKPQNPQLKEKRFIELEFVDNKLLVLSSLIPSFPFCYQAKYSCSESEKTLVVSYYQYEGGNQICNGNFDLDGKHIVEIKPSCSPQFLKINFQSGEYKVMNLNP